MVDTIADKIVTIEQPGIEIDERRTMLAQQVSLGLGVGQIADSLQVSEAWVRNHKRDPEVGALVKELQLEAVTAAKLAVTHASVLAAQTMTNLLDCPKPEIQLSAAKDILDRLGIKTAQKTESTVNIKYADLSRDEIKQSLASRMAALEDE